MVFLRFFLLTLFFSIFKPSARSKSALSPYLSLPRRNKTTVLKIEIREKKKSRVRGGKKGAVEKEAKTLNCVRTEQNSKRKKTHSSLGSLSHSPFRARSASAPAPSARPRPPGPASPPPSPSPAAAASPRAASCRRHRFSSLQTRRAAASAPRSAWRPG